MNKLADQAAETLRRAVEARGPERLRLQEEALRLHRLATAPQAPPAPNPGELRT